MPSSSRSRPRRIGRGRPLGTTTIHPLTVAILAARHGGYGSTLCQLRVMADGTASLAHLRAGTTKHLIWVTPSL
jgi:hypothetical protein